MLDLFLCNKGRIAPVICRVLTFARRFTTEDKAALHCMALCGHLVAAGAAGKVLFFDRRSSQLCGSFDDMHAEDVTQVGYNVPAAVFPGALAQCKCTASNLHT